MANLSVAPFPKHMSDPISPDPVSANSPEPAVVQSPASGAGTELQPNLAAALACFFSILGGMGGIIFLVLEKKNRFVRFYAMQSFLFGAVWFVLFIATWTVAAVLTKIPFLGWLFALVFGLAYLLIGLGFVAVWIITMVNAFNNKEWEIPYFGPIARKQLISGPLSKL
jgi:uncharacterized membrane protein